MAELGITEYQEAPFADFCALSPEDFVRKVLVDCFAARAVFCGDNFTFGAKAAGNVALLQTLCAAQGIETRVVEMAQYQGQVVSSTRIRAARRTAAFRTPTPCWARPYAIDWPVGHGKHVGTSRLGTPTINQNYPAGALEPGCGVYLTRIWLGRPLVSFGHRHRPPPHRGCGRRAHITCETYGAGFLRRRLRPAPPAGVPPVSLPHPQV